MRAPFCVSVGIDVLRQILNLETVNRGGIRLGVVAGMSLAIANVKASPPVTQHAYVGNYGNNTVAVIDTATQTVINTVPVGSYPRGVAVAPDGQYAYVTNANDNSVSVIDTGTETVVNTIPVGSYPIGVAVTPDSQYAYVGNLHGNTVSVINTTTQTVVATINVGDYPIGVVAMPNGKYVYVANSNSNTVSVIDTASQTVGYTITGKDFFSDSYGIAAAPDGLRVYVGSYGGPEVTVIDSDRAKPAAIKVVNADDGRTAYGVAVTIDSKYVYVTKPFDFQVAVIQTSKEAAIKTIPAGSYPEGVAVTPDGVSVYAVNLGGTVSVISTKTQTLSNTISVGSELSALGNFIGPNMVVGVLGVDNEATLTQSGFGQWVTLTGGVLQTKSSLNDAHSLRLVAPGGTISVGAGTTSTFSGTIIGNGSLTKTGPGTLILKGNNTYKGGTNIDGGTLMIDNYRSLGTGPVTVHGGSLKVLHQE
jgi:YVTN family beta-propeller protein/autotransporter-associated beta strand protein